MLNRVLVRKLINPITMAKHSDPSLLNNLKIQIDENWHKINLLITSMHIEDIQPLLNHYSKKDEKAVKQHEGYLKEISLLKNHLIYLGQQVNLLAADRVNDKNLVRHINQQICIANHQLNMAEWFCKTYLNRLLKKIHLAKAAVDQWIAEIHSYKKFISVNNLPYSETLLNLYLANAYNHQAKIHRALAGHDLNKLDPQQLQLSADSYQQALKLVYHPVILNGLGFLSNDRSLLDQSLSYHEAALAMDNQDPNTYHGIGYTLYKIEKRRYDTSGVIIHENLDRALSALTFAQQKNSNGRIFLDKALVYLLLNNENKALENLNQGLIIDPYHALLLYERGCLFLGKGHLISAMQDLRLGRTVSIDSQSLINLFDKAIEQATKKLNLEYESAPQSETKLDIREIAKQQAFEDGLRKFAHYAELLRPHQNKISVFISYAWANKEHIDYEKQLVHVENIKQLARELEIAGFNVLLDRWNDVKGNNISDFIEKIFDGFVLVIGTHHYLEKYNKLPQQEKADPVVKAEVCHIKHLLHYNEKTRAKIMTVLLEGTVEESLPKILHAKIPTDLVKNDKFREMFKLVGDIHRFPLRDERINRIISQFDSIRKEIDEQSPKELAKAYKQSLITLNNLFKKQNRDSRQAHELLQNSSELRSKL